MVPPPAPPPLGSSLHTRNLPAYCADKSATIDGDDPGVLRWHEVYNDWRELIASTELRPDWEQDSSWSALTSVVVFDELTRTETFTLASETRATEYLLVNDMVVRSTTSIAGDEQTGLATVAYDPRGNPIEQVQPNVPVHLFHEFDEDSRLVRSETDHGDNGSVDLVRTLHRSPAVELDIYDRDADGSRDFLIRRELDELGRTVLERQVGGLSDTTTVFQWDEGRLVDRVTRTSNGDREAVSYDYDGWGRLRVMAAIWDSGGGTITRWRYRDCDNQSSSGERALLEP